MPAPKLKNNLSEFKSNFFGYIKPSLYEVAFSGKVFDNMIAMSGAGSYVPNLITRNCEVASLPGTAVSSQPSRIYGPVREMVYEKLYSGDLQLTFRMDERMYLRTFFNFWQDFIHNKQTGDFEYYDEYKCDILIYQYPTKQSWDFGFGAKSIQHPIYGVKLIECYPKSISEIELGYGQRDTYMKQIIDFAYRKWEEIPRTEL